MVKDLRSKTITGLVWKFAERITAQLTSTLVSIILARLLLPEQYGAVSIVTVFISLCNVLVVEGLASGLIQKQDADELDFSTMFFTSIALSAVLYGVLFCFAPFIASFYDMPILCPVLRVMGIRLIISAINSVQQAYVSRTMQFKRFFWSTLFGTVISGVVGIAMAFKGFGVWALVSQYLTNSIIDTVVLFFTAKWRPHLQFSFNRAKKLIPFGMKIAGGSVVNELYKSARSLIIGKVYSAEQLSYYTKAQTYPQLLTTNINSSINSVLFPAIAKVQDDKKRIVSMLKRSVKTSSFFILPMMVGFAFVSESFVRILLTEKWLPCVPYMRIFCIGLCFAPLSAANLQSIKAVGRGDIAFKQEMIKKLVGLVIIFATSAISVYAIAIGAALCELWFFVVNIWPCKRLFNYSIRDQLSDMLPNIVCTGIMGCVLLGISLLKMNYIMTFVIQIILGVFSYIIICAITKNDSFCYCVEFVKKSLKGKK